MPGDMIFTSESVTQGHPDKLCDQISDAAIDVFLRHDAGVRAVVECAVATGVVFIAARSTGAAAIDLPSLAKAGCNRSKKGAVTTPRRDPKPRATGHGVNDLGGGKGRTQRQHGARVTIPSSL